MPMNAAARRDPSAGGWVRLSILIAALLLVAGLAFIGSGMTGTAQGQAERGAIPSLALVSNEPGQLVITWGTPEQAPTDYRLSWAYSSLDFPSYRDSNEAGRGNLYPAGGATTLTLNDLTPGENYKVQLRARYYNADRSVHEWSGPWTAVATQRVKNPLTGGAHRAHGGSGRPQRPDPDLGRPPGRKHHRLPGPEGTRRRQPVHHRGGHGERQHGVHGRHRGGGDHLLLRGPGPERGRRRGTVQRHQRHHAGSAPAGGAPAGGAHRAHGGPGRPQRPDPDLGRPPGRKHHRLPRSCG